MADLPAAEGSFEWAIIELKNGKRVSREAWNEKRMYLVRNPGDPDQTVKDGDWLANAGVPVDTAFDYLPNIVISNAEGNFVPYQPSQVDMEIKDWGSFEKSSQAMLTVDISNGYWEDERIKAWGYATGSDYQGKYNIIENTIPSNVIFAFEYVIWINNPNSFAIKLLTTPENKEYFRDLFNKPVKITVDEVNATLSSPFNIIIGDTNCSCHYSIDGFDELSKKFMTRDQTHRFYCTWAD